MTYHPRGAISVANALRARGLARGLGVAPSGFDMRSTILAPQTQRLGGFGQRLIDAQHTNVIAPATVQPSPLVTANVAPAGTSSGWSPPESPFTAGGVTTASDRVAEAQRQQSPSDPGGNPLVPAPTVRVNGPVPYEGPPVARVTSVPPSTSLVSRLPFGWPWWVWGLIVVGGGIGIFALTRR